MRTRWIGLALWTGAGLLVLGSAPPCRAQPGPDDGGAVLRNPFEDSTPRAASKGQSSVPGAATQAASGAGDNSNAYERFLAQLTLDPRYAMNRDIQPTPELGPWMICVHSYVTPEAPEFAR